MIVITLCGCFIQKVYIARYTGASHDFIDNDICMGACSFINELDLQM